MLKIYTLKDIGLKGMLKFLKEGSFSHQSVLRSLMKIYLEKIVKEHDIKGKILLDIGGKEGHKKYIEKYIKVNHYFIGNLDTGNILMDATQNHPFKSNTIDIVISFNLIEHLPEFNKHIEESIRIAKKYYLIFIPFTMYYHPSPEDHWRLAQDQLLRIAKKLKEKERIEVKIIPVSLGPFIASMQYKKLVYDRVKFIKILPLIYNLILDVVLLSLYSWLKNRKSIYQLYPLGYFVIIKKLPKRR